MTTNRPEFNAHDDFIFEHKKIGKVTREEFIKYIRSSHEHMRKLSQIIQQYNQTFDGYLEEWDGRFESFDDDVKDLLGRWIQDGTMDHIINENLMSSKADKTYVDDLNETVTAQLAQKVNQTQVGGLQPQTLRNVKLVDEESNTPRIIDIFDGYIWADNVNYQLMRRHQSGGEWEVYPVTIPGTSPIYRLLKTNDGEMLAVHRTRIYKSIGWSGTPSQVTWKEVLSANDTTWFLAWGVDGDTDGRRFIATTYEAGEGFSNSRYVKMSHDGGNTWTTVYDSVEYHGATLANESHMHAVCYDKWSDRFYFAEGHGEIAGIYVSEDDGATWNRAHGMIQDPAPTVIVATDEGLVCGTDTVKNGLFGVIREDDPMDEELVQTWSWKTGRDGLIGFAQRGYRDPKTGVVYVGFRTAYSDVYPVIAAGTATSGSLIYTWEKEDVATTDNISSVLVNGNELLAKATSSFGNKFLTASVPKPGVPSEVDLGNIKGGTANQATSTSVGFGAEVLGLRSLAVGVGAKSTGEQNSVAIGYNSLARSNSLAVGQGSEAGATSTALGDLSNASGGLSTAIGRRAISGPEGVSIGVDSNSGSFSVSIGKNAKTATGNAQAVAIGRNTVAHTNSVAIGDSTETTGSNQVSFGDRYMEINAVSSAGTLAMDAKKVRLFARENEGKVELCVMVPGQPTPVVLASN